MCLNSFQHSDGSRAVYAVQRVELIGTGMNKYTRGKCVEAETGKLALYSIRDTMSDTIVLCRGSQKGYTVSRLCSTYSLCTNDCVSHHHSTKVVKFANNSHDHGRFNQGC